jgi:hypothetical protein
MRRSPEAVARLLPAHELFALLAGLLTDDPLHRPCHALALLDVDR